MSVVIPVILCGGSGTRLWPLSRSDRPKQLIALGSDQTLLDGTLLRTKAIVGVGDPICVTAAEYAVEVRQSLDRLRLRGRLLVEPEPRNTAPAICAAALFAMRTDPNAVIVALPADHVIANGEIFAASIGHAVAAAEKGWLTILGVRPRHASSALGYIMPADTVSGLPKVHHIDLFIEKPQLEIAKGLISAGALWNAGIVIARAATVIEAMRKLVPAVLDAMERSLLKGQIENDDILLSVADFIEAPDISFDKAVLERHETIAVTYLETLWRDVGTWAEVAELYPADGDGNRQSGRVKFSSSHNSFVLSPHRLTVGIGLTDLIVVDTPDALLIANRNDLGLIRESVEALTADSYPGLAVADEQLGVQKIKLRRSEISIRQPHSDLTRYWIILEGSVRLTIKSISSIHLINECFQVPPGVFYTIASLNSASAELIEIHLIAPLG